MVGFDHRTRGSRMQRVLFLFIDGLGLGDPDVAENPLRDADLDLLASFHAPGWAPPPEGGRPPELPAVHRDRPLPHGGLVAACDASLGVEGLPQSATGQTTLLTGENGAEVLGRHYTGFPTRTLQKILMQDSIFRKLTEAGRSARFANAFGPMFFSLGDAVWEKPRMGATSWANRAAGLPFLDFAALAEGRAVFHDLTHDTMNGNDPRLGGATPLAPVTPETAGERLAALSAAHDFTLHEFFLTDKAGHEADEGWALHELRKYERFLAAVLAAVDLSATTVLLTSDHGNIEDLRTGRHTHNPVPFLAFGAEAERFHRDVRRLEDFTPAVLAGA